MSINLYYNLILYNIYYETNDIYYLIAFGEAVVLGN